MSLMTRKQIYIEPQQAALLKRLAQRLGMSEAELIREAIDRHIGGGAMHTLSPDPLAWEEALEFMRGLQAQDAERGRTWKREELYADRVGRHDRHPD
jgi:predicted DNA-binding protein